MTPQEVDKLEAGRELDGLIALHVFGEIHIWARGSDPPYPHYSTDIPTAYIVVRAIREMGYPVETGTLTAEPLQRREYCKIWLPGRREPFVERGPDHCMCICRAALKAVTQPPPQNPPR